MASFILLATLFLRWSIQIFADDAETCTGAPTYAASTATNMGKELVGTGVSFVSATYKGSTKAAGIVTFPCGNPLNISAGGPSNATTFSVVVLSTGDVEAALSSLTTEPPSTELGGAGDSDVAKIVGGTTSDAAVLTITLKTTRGGWFRFPYVFASCENTTTEAPALLVNGEVVSLVPDTEEPVTNMNAMFAHNMLQGIEDDGLVLPFCNWTTVMMTSKVQVSAQKTVTVKLAIADAGTKTLDSAVIIPSGMFYVGSQSGKEEIDQKEEYETKADFELALSIIGITLGSFPTGSITITSTSILSFGNYLYCTYSSSDDALANITTSFAEFRVTSWGAGVVSALMGIFTSNNLLTATGLELEIPSGLTAVLYLVVNRYNALKALITASTFTIEIKCPKRIKFFYHFKTGSKQGKELKSNGGEVEKCDDDDEECDKITSETSAIGAYTGNSAVAISGMHTVWIGMLAYMITMW